jgi:hypothetical protein
MVAEPPEEAPGVAVAEAVGVAVGVVEGFSVPEAAGVAVAEVLGVVFGEGAADFLTAGDRDGAGAGVGVGPQASKVTQVVTAAAVDKRNVRGCMDLAPIGERRDELAYS